VAQKPDGKPANLQKVQFTRPAAERIARVVRQVELGNRDAAPLRFSPRTRSFGGSGTTLTTTTITVLTGVVLSTTNLTFQRASISVVGSTTAASQVISVYNCPSVSVSAEGQAFYYG